METQNTIDPIEFVDVVRQHWLTHGVGPTTREIGEVLGCSRTASMYRARTLVEKGLLIWPVKGKEHIGRALRPPDIIITQEQSHD